MRWLKLTIAYDGSAYAGWQVQAGQPTIQQTFERTWRQITGESLRAIASGRTDSGVHALGQVVSLCTASDLSRNVLRRALNAELPEDIVVHAVEEAPAGFHAVRDAVKKRYRYLIHDDPVRPLFRRNYVWRWRIRLDERAMHRAAQTLLGRHDFVSFQSAGEERLTTIRTITEIAVVRGREGRMQEIAIDVEADGFLYNMVRTIVGTLCEVGRGARPETWPLEVLRSASRPAAGPTAPSLGLFLVQVDYESDRPQADEIAAADP